MKRRTILILITGLFALGSWADGAAAEDFVVIVNKVNTFEGAPDAAKPLLKSLFLKKRKDWGGGLEAKPFSFKPGTPEAEAFREVVLQMSTAELSEHWLAVKQTTGETAPREVPSAALAAKFVQKFEGGFCVMKKADAEGLGDTVRIVLAFSHG